MTAQNLNKKSHRDYWEQNIKGFSKFYDSISEENIGSNSLFTILYKKLVFPIEKKVTRERYNIVCEYIEKNVYQGMKVADIGCGSGIFTKLIVKHQVNVYALDYSQSALDLTHNSLTENETKSVNLIKADILSEHIPTVDLVISIGVIPYIDDINRYFDNILPFTQKILFNYLDANNMINIVRRILPFLDVRHYYYQSNKDILSILEQYNFKVNNIIKLSTGFMIDAEHS